MASQLIYPLDIGSTYNFSLLAQAILGAGYSSAVVKGILDYSSAIQIADVTGQHAAVLPALPPGTPADPKVLLYIKIETSTGETRVIAQNWIATPPVLVVATSATVIVSNISTADLPRLREVLVSNGFQSIEISSS
jgi:hypothetical protein